MRFDRILVAAVVFVSVATVASAAIVQYDDRATWEGNAGAINLSEDFAGFAADADFKLVPVAIGVGSIEQVGIDAAFRNIVDVSPFLFTDNNGTNHASCFVNAFEPGPAPPLSGDGDEDTPPADANTQTGGTDVLITFTSPVSAWGADFNGVLGGEFLAVDVLGAGDVTLGTILPAAGDTFLGFVADAGEQAVAVLLRSQNLNPGGGGEGFGMDNLSAATGGGGDGGGVPATTGVGLVLLILAMGGGSAYFLRRR